MSSISFPTVCYSEDLWDYKSSQREFSNSSDCEFSWLYRRCVSIISVSNSHYWIDKTKYTSDSRNPNSFEGVSVWKKKQFRNENDTTKLKILHLNLFFYV